MKHLLFNTLGLLLAGLISAQPAGKETILFDNWAAAKNTYQWQWLETPKEDENVYRYFSNDALMVVNKTPEHIWTQADLPFKPLPSFWKYEAIFNNVKGKSENVETGILLTANSNGEEIKVFFVVNHFNQTYAFIQYNMAKREWLHLNKLMGNTNNFSASINKYDAQKDFASNKLKLQREGDNFLLYINDKLVETVALNNSLSALDNLHGIGITGKGNQAYYVNNVKFSVFENPPNYKEKKLTDNASPRLLGSIIIACGPEGYAMTSFKVYEWYGTTVGKKYGALWKGINDYLNIGDGKGCKMHTYFEGKTPEEAVPFQYKELDKSIRKKVTYTITGLRIVMKDDGIAVASVVNANNNPTNSTFGNGIQHSSADMSQFSNNGNSSNSTSSKTITAEQAANKDREYVEFINNLKNLDEKFKPYGQMLMLPPEKVFLTRQWKQRARYIVDSQISLVEKFMKKWGEYLSASDLKSYKDRLEHLNNMVYKIGG